MTVGYHGLDEMPESHLRAGTSPAPWWRARKAVGLTPSLAAKTRSCADHFFDAPPGHLQACADAARECAY